MQIIRAVCRGRGGKKIWTYQDSDHVERDVDEEITRLSEAGRVQFETRTIDPGEVEVKQSTEASTRQEETAETAP